MKKILNAIAVLSALLLAFSCAKQNAETNDDPDPVDNSELPTENSTVARAIYLTDTYLNMFRNGVITVDDDTLGGYPEFSLCRDLWISTGSYNGAPYIGLLKNKVTKLTKWWGSMDDENNCYQPYAFPEDERNTILNYFKNDPRVSSTRLNGGTIEIYVKMN